MKEYFILKYALTSGVYKTPLDIMDDNYAIQRKISRDTFNAYIQRKDYCETESEAREVFEAKRKKEIASLEKQL